MKKVSASFLVFIFSLTMFSGALGAGAQENTKGFSIAPFFQEITIQPDGADQPFSLEVTNNSGEPMVFRLSVLDFGALDESGGVAFLGTTDPEQKYGLASWISLENDTLVLGPGENKTVKGTVQNKESLSPGGHYGAIFFKTENGGEAAASDENNVTLDPSFASLLFVRKLGGEIYGLQLSDENPSPGLFTLPKTVRPRFQNTGNVHVTPRGIVEISDPLGRPVAKGIINSESGIILPETFRVFPTPLSPLALAFVPGKYQISIAYRYDGKADFFGRNYTFFFIPPAFVGIILLLAGGITAFWRWRRKAPKA